jgi:CHAD domain-containing protein
VKARAVPGVDERSSVAMNAARIVRVRVDELYGFDPAVRDPANVTELHDMRIAAKRLRYVLEITGHCFDEIGEEAESAARSLQDVLGEIHDCDVLIPRVDRELATLREQDARTLGRLVSDPDDLPAAVRRAPARARYRGLETLAAALTARRSLLYDRFLTEWSGVVDDGLRKRLDRTLDDVSAR